MSTGANEGHPRQITSLPPTGRCANPAHDEGQFRHPKRHDCTDWVSSHDPSLPTMVCPRCNREVTRSVDGICARCASETRTPIPPYADARQQTLDFISDQIALNVGCDDVQHAFTQLRNQILTLSEPT